MLIKKPYTGTRLGLGDVDLVQPLNPQHPLMRGAESFWPGIPKLTGGGKLYDLAGSTNGAILGPRWSYRSQRSIPALDYVEQNDVVSLGARGVGKIIQGKPRVSLWAWIYPRDISSPDGFDRTVLSTFISSSDVSQLYFAVKPSGALRVSARSSPDDNLRTAEIGSAVSVNRWHYVGFVVDLLSKTARAYHNGALLGSQSQAYGDESFSAASPTRMDVFGGFERGDGTFDSAWDGYISDPLLSTARVTDAYAWSLYDQARRGFPDLLNRRPAMTVVDMAVAPPPGDTIEATADPSLAADHAATLQPTPATLAATADLTLAQDYAAAIGTQPGAIQATADASLSADYAALLQPQPVTLQATPDASGASDYAGAIQPTPVTLSASSDLSLAQDYAATITEVDAPVVIEASADLSLGADYAASVVAVPVMISIGFDPSLGADFAAFLSDSSASQTVQARISTGERFTSNTSSSERVS